MGSYYTYCFASYFPPYLIIFSQYFWLFCMKWGHLPLALTDWDCRWIAPPLRVSVSSSVKGNSPFPLPCDVSFKGESMWKCRCPPMDSSEPSSVPFSCLTRFGALTMTWNSLISWVVSLFVPPLEVKLCESKDHISSAHHRICPPNVERLLVYGRKSINIF